MMETAPETRPLPATFAALLILISTASQAQPPGPGTVKASNAFIDCLMKAARKLDDRRSSSDTVAKSIQDKCLNEQHRWENAQTANYTAEKRREFLQGMKTQTASIAVQIVTEQRKFKPLIRQSPP